MKKIYKSLIFLFSLFVLVSCEDFMDIHKKYVEGGEIIYAPKPDSIAFIAGKGRIMLRCWLYNSPNVRTIDVLWNGGQDSLAIPVTPSSGLDSLDVILPDMPEKSYTFTVRTTDSYGHHSLVVTNFGSSYGDLYKSMLIDRRIKSVELSDKGGVLNWYSFPEGLVGNEVRYTKRDGGQAHLFMPAKDNSLSFPDVKAGSVFEYRSLYIPEEESIDTFYTDWTTYDTAFPLIYQYDRSKWSVLACSDQKESDGGGMKTLIDGDLKTFWHSSYGPDVPPPHWAVIDMMSSKKICQFDVYRRSGSTDSKTVQLFVGTNQDPDAAGWVKVGEGIFPAKGDKLQIEIPASVSTDKGRYLKIVLPDSNRTPFTSIAEVYVYGN